jgi:hypothetical protein
MNAVLVVEVCLFYSKQIFCFLLNCQIPISSIPDYLRLAFFVVCTEQLNLKRAQTVVWTGIKLRSVRAKERIVNPDLDNVQSPEAPKNTSAQVVVMIGDLLRAFELVLGPNNNNNRHSHL